MVLKINKYAEVVYFAFLAPGPNFYLNRAFACSLITIIIV